MLRVMKYETTNEEDLEEIKVVQREMQGKQIDEPF